VCWFRQVYINRVEIVEVNDLRTLGGIIHSLNGTLSPTLNRCDQLTADHQLVRAHSRLYCFVLYSPSLKHWLLIRLRLCHHLSSREVVNDSTLGLCSTLHCEPQQCTGLSWQRPLLLCNCHNKYNMHSFINFEV